MLKIGDRILLRSYEDSIKMIDDIQELMVENFGKWHTITSITKAYAPNDWSLRKYDCYIDNTTFVYYDCWIDREKMRELKIMDIIGDYVW